MTQAQHHKITNGVWHYPGSCGKCRVEFFGKYYDRAQFIKANRRGGREDDEKLGRSFDERLEVRRAEMKAAGIKVEFRDCERCGHTLEILVEPQ